MIIYHHFPYNTWDTRRQFFIICTSDKLCSISNKKWRSYGM